MSLEIGNLQAVMRRYRQACPDTVGDRGCEAFQDFCRGMGTMEEMGSELDRRIAEIEGFLESLDKEPDPQEKKRILSQPVPLEGNGNELPDNRNRNERNSKPKEIDMPDFDISRSHTSREDEARNVDAGTKKQAAAWTSVLRAVSGMEKAMREVDRLLGLEVRAAGVFEEAKADWAALSELQERPRLDRAAAAARLAKVQEGKHWCMATLQSIQRDRKPFETVPNSACRILFKEVRDAIAAWLAKPDNTRNRAIENAEKRISALEATCTENERAARAGLQSLDQLERQVSGAGDRLQELALEIENALNEDEALESTIDRTGAGIVSILQDLEAELRKNSSKQPSIVQASKGNPNWDISICGEAETKHIRTSQRLEGVSECRSMVRSIEALQPPLEALSVEALNLTQAFPPLIALGDTVYTHSQPGVELSMPSVFAFPFAKPLLMPEACAAPMLLRLAWTLPAGKISFVALDQETLGENLRPLNGFGECPGLLRVVTSVDAMREELSALQSEIASVTGGAFKGDIRNWADYNAAHPGAPLPCKMLVIHSLAGFERGFGLSETLANVLKNGPRCGVFSIVTEEALEKIDAREAEKFRTVVFEKMYPPPAEDGADWHCLRPERMLPELPENVAELASGYAATVKRSLEKPAKGFEELFAGEQFWGGNASKGFEVVMGWDNRGDPVRFCLGDRIPHALLGGATGSGKSNLIHILIHALCHRYSPEELNLYLLDYKDGLEFQKYVAAGKSWLPHARTISTVNDPGYALTLFAFLKEEQKRRKRTFGGLSSYVEYRAAGKKMPRIVVLIDEFHKMFEGMSVDAVCDGLTDIFKQGRAYGIHLVLATQTLNGLQFPGKKGMLDQIGIRLALHSNTGEDDILQPGNTAAKDIKIPQCILNEAGGNKGANRVFSLPHADHEGATGMAFRKRCTEGAARKGIRCGCRVFDGMRLPKLPTETALSSLLSEAPPSYDSYLALGVRNEFLARPFVACFDDEPGGHLLVCGENGDIDEDGNVTGVDVWNGLRAAAWRSLAAQGAAFLHYDPLARGKPSAFPREGVFVGAEAKDDAALLAAFDRVLKSGAPQKFVLVENYGRARLLHPETALAPLFGRGRDAEPPVPTARAAFLAAFANGAEPPFHAVLFIRNFENTRRAVLEKSRETNILAGCAKRIAFNLAKADMENFMPRTRRMDTKGRVLFCDETQPDPPVSILAYSAE